MAPSSSVGATGGAEPQDPRIPEGSTAGEVAGDLTLAIALLVVAGFVDAVGFLTLGHLFVSFQSGNSTQFAIAIGGVSLTEAYLAGALVGAFVAGVVVGKMLALVGKDWRRPLILIVELPLLGAAALVPLSAVRAAFLMALAMGAQNGVLHKAGQTRTALTYVTGTVVNFGERLAEAVFRVGPAWAWLPYLLLWIGIVCGGAAGTMAYGEWRLRALLIPTFVVVVLAAVTAATAWRRRRL